MNFKTVERRKPLALIVDDDYSLRLSLGAALVKAGFDTREAEDGQVGTRLFESERPDLILMDAMMPKMDGFEACASIRKLPGGESVQILMVTGLEDTESTEKAFVVGANGFISKPINWMMLGHRCKYMLRAGRAFQELERGKNRLAKIQKLAKLGNWEIDMVNNVFYCSPEAHTLLGLQGDSSKVSFEQFFSTIVPEELEHVKKKIHYALDEHKTFSVNYIIKRVDGSKRHILNHGEIVRDEKSNSELLLGAVQDVTQLKIAEEEIRLLAFYDSLTGLANRMLFLNRLDLEIAKAFRNDQQFALLFLDLDHFKRINDTYGHHRGDLLLKEVSVTLQKCIRSTDVASRMNEEGLPAMVARLGGDEFTVILSDIKEPENVVTVARRILDEIPRTYNLDGNEVSVTTSIGISIFPADGVEGSSLLKNADSAMYQAKNRGRNNYQFYEKSLNAAAIERYSLQQDITKALERNEFSLHFQPQISIATQEIVGCEALIRWQHPEKGMIAPDKFIQIAEESGQIVEVNRWVMRAALSQCRRWRDLGLPAVRVAVNLSGYQFAQQGIVEQIRQGLEENAVDADQVEIEITENILMQDTHETIAILEELKSLNLRVALDDFGTGFSSLSYLTSFPVDTIKIDRSFVMNCLEKKDNLVIIRAIVAMGHSLGMTIVAEGVETAEQLKIVGDFGVDKAQGYFFSPPVPEEEFSALLRKKKIE